MNKQDLRRDFNGGARLLRIAAMAAFIGVSAPAPPGC